MTPKIDITFTPNAGSGALMVEFYDVQKVESFQDKAGKGRYWLKDGVLAGVEFEDVDAASDKQRIESDKGEWVEIEVVDGQISVRSSVLKKVQRAV